MRKTDLVIEVLDARAPRSSCNPVFERLRRAGQRPALKLLNKSDVADPEQTRRWLQHYNAQPGVQAIGLCAKKQGELERILTACRALRPDRGAPDKPLRMMILGIPNVGKSTLMNAILKRHVAHVGDEPAITKIQMFHRLGPGMSLVDTPGMLWPGMEQATALPAGRAPQHRARGLRRRGGRADAGTLSAPALPGAAGTSGSACSPAPATSTCCWRSSPRGGRSPRSPAADRTSPGPRSPCSTTFAPARSAGSRSRPSTSRPDRRDRAGPAHGLCPIGSAAGRGRSTGVTACAKWKGNRRPATVICSQTYLAW